MECEFLEYDLLKILLSRYPVDIHYLYTAKKNGLNPSLKSVIQEGDISFILGETYNFFENMIFTNKPDYLRRGKCPTLNS